MKIEAKQRLVATQTEAEKIAYRNDLNKAQDQRASPAELKTLAGHQEDQIRSLVAKNPACPLPVLKKLAKDKSKEVRRGVASNLKTPVELMLALEQDHESYVSSLAKEMVQKRGLNKKPEKKEEPYFKSKQEEDEDAAAARRNYERTKQEYELGE